MTATFSPVRSPRSGFSLDTLRYYEKIGLLSNVERTASGHRRFGEDDLEWLEVLRCLRDTGMPIAQMRRYAELSRGGQATLMERTLLLIEHDACVQAQITLLQARRDHLQGKIDWYRSQLNPPLRALAGQRRSAAWACPARRECNTRPLDICAATPQPLGLDRATAAQYWQYAALTAGSRIPLSSEALSVTHGG